MKIIDELKLKFHKARKARLKELAKSRALADNGKPYDFYDYLDAKEMEKYDKSALYVYRAGHPTEGSAFTDITGWSKQFDKQDLSWYSALKSERQFHPDTHHLEVKDDSHVEVTFLKWQDPDTGIWHDLPLEDGSLAGYAIHQETIPALHGNLVSVKRIKNVEVPNNDYIKRKAWDAGVRGPND